MIGVGLYLLISGPGNSAGLSIVLTVIGTVAAVVQAVLAYVTLKDQRRKGAGHAQVS